METTSRSRPPSSGFTLVELIAVAAVVTLLCFMLGPALARPRLAGQNVTCLENMRQLSLALALYANDSADYLPPNPDDGNTTPGRNWVGGQAGSGGGQEFNPDILSDPRRSMLADNLGDASVFHCPNDTRTGRYQGTNVALIGKTVPAARSYAMNLAVGTNPYKSAGKAPVDAAWLDGSHGHTAGKTWLTFARTGDMLNPGPARTFAFLDEDYRSLNDGNFAVVGPKPANPSYTMIDWPATYHGFGANFAFADGHSETRVWRDARTRLTGAWVSQQPGNVDIVWMSAHATALMREVRLTAGGPPSTNTFDLVVPGVKGVGYTLEYKDSLSSAQWTPLPRVTAATNGPLRLTDPAATNLQRFYRAWTP